MRFGCKECKRGLNSKWFDVSQKCVEPCSTDKTVGSVFKDSAILADIFNYSPTCIKQYYKDLILKAMKVYVECELKGVMD